MSAVSCPIVGLGRKCYPNTRKYCTVYQILEQNINKLLSLKCKQKLRGFPEGKNFDRRVVLIWEFHKKLLKVIRKKDKFDPQNCNLQIANSNYLN